MTPQPPYPMAGTYVEFFWTVSLKESDIFVGNFCLQSFEKIMNPSTPWLGLKIFGWSHLK